MLGKFVIGAMAVSVLLLFGNVAIAQDHVAERAATVTQIRTLADSEIRLKKFLYSELIPLPDQTFPPEDMSLDFVTVDDVTIAGAQYTLIFVGSDDVLGWDTYKQYLPAQVAQGPATPPTDEQVMAYLDRLTETAGNNFEVVFTKDFEENKAAYTAAYPENFTEEQVLESVKSVFEFNDNGENKPEIQRAYNEYAALATLRGGLEFYLTHLKGKKL